MLCRCLGARLPACLPACLPFFPLAYVLLPLAGDWALDRFAAVFLQGTESPIIDGCTFDRLDGNGVMISGT